MRALVFVLLLGCGTNVDLGGGGPSNGDGGPILTCGDLVAPQVTAGCRACTPGSDDCQPNGCYGGYWCNVSATDCHVPPKTCP